MKTNREGKETMRKRHERGTKKEIKCKKRKEKGTTNYSFIVRERESVYLEIVRVINVQYDCYFICRY